MLGGCHQWESCIVTPQYCSGSLPVLQQLHALCPGSPSHTQSPVPSNSTLELENYQSGRFRLSWHGGNHSVDTVAVSESAADRFVQLGLLQEYLGGKCCEEKWQQGAGVCTEGQKEPFLMDIVFRLPCV